MDIYPGTDGGKESCYSQPHCQFSVGGNKVKRGTFRSTNCNGITENARHICYACSKIPQMKSFIKRLKLKSSKIHV